MIEITLISNAKKIFTRKNGEKVVFHKDKTRYFAEDDEVANRIQRLSENERVGTFKINTEIQQYPIASGWRHFSPNRWKEMLETLGIDTENLKRQPDYIKRVEEAIESGLIVVRENSGDEEEGGDSQLKALQEENEDLQSKLRGVQTKLGKTKKAFEDTIADLLDRIETLEGEKNSETKKDKE